MVGRSSEHEEDQQDDDVLSARAMLANLQSDVGLDVFKNQGGVLSYVLDPKRQAGVRCF